MDEKEFRLTVAANIIKYRKAKRLTQLELAELLNYSDKAVSKWERGESLPDVMVLKEIADYFGITLDALITNEKDTHHKIGLFSIKKRIMIPIISAVLVWIVATLTFAFFSWFNTPFFVTNDAGKYAHYYVFIYAVPISFVVFLIFSVLWWTNITSGIFASAIIWTVSLSIYLSLGSVNNMWTIFLVSGTCQVAVILWFFMIPQKNKLRRVKQKKVADNKEKKEAE